MSSCPHCSTDMGPVPWWDMPRFCSAACALARDRRERLQLGRACFRPGCGVEVPHSAATYCSRRCEAADTPQWTYEVPAVPGPHPPFASYPHPLIVPPTGRVSDHAGTATTAVPIPTGPVGPVAYEPAPAGVETPATVSDAQRGVEPLSILGMPVRLDLGMDEDAVIIESAADSSAIIGGTVIHNVHQAARCEGRPCVIHHPSSHHMRDWPKRWRDDRRMVERECPHGVGHPDPDDLAYRLTRPGPVGERDSGVHGCDGCCVDPALAHLGPVADRAVTALLDPACPTSECARCGKTYQVLGSRVDLCGLCFLRQVNDEIAAAKSRRPWWARLLRRSA